MKTLQKTNFESTEKRYKGSIVLGDLGESSPNRYYVSWINGATNVTERTVYYTSYYTANTKYIFRCAQAPNVDKP